MVDEDDGPGGRGRLGRSYLCGPLVPRGPLVDFHAGGNAAIVICAPGPRPCGIWAWTGCPLGAVNWTKAPGGAPAGTWTVRFIMAPPAAAGNATTGTLLHESEPQPNTPDHEEPERRVASWVVGRGGSA